ncbi:pyridoxamine 5'-phosphate oxidase family protein [Saccharopolyspora hirsuta]|uniref:Pyridoxamine 5'-phosphate oxidase family protein n=1 Tax=Saccharopolyspora hirsuta TaxID=1837 RepID=A0A5M7CD01_SACHI|nr:pyridoxamine 5'-phosphate oxidase family protein [Saccharopolyspora hirsuta]KAA5836275.1 pyridoxamine 5'-phosphate oxidase family protein [Saccharopolyspora hirsuta]
MSTWQEFAEQAPEMAARVRARLESFQHHVLATLRRDGSPRVSGTEVAWRGPDLTFGSMPGSRKAADLLRDARFALHANPGAPEDIMGGVDVKLAGRAVEVTGDEHRAWIEEVKPPSPDSHLFRLELTEVTTTGVSEDQTHLAITRWTPAGGVQTFKRT